jgi:hypothetical protein
MESKKRIRPADRAGRLPMQSPGRPPVWRREHKQLFWKAISRGLSSEEAATVASVSPAVGGRWFREGGGMATVSTARHSGRYLSFGEREEIALLRAQACDVREIARRLGRASSTISRELRRNAATRSGAFQYRATTAQWHADRRAQRPKKAKLANQPCPEAVRPGASSRNAQDTQWHERTGSENPVEGSKAWTSSGQKVGRCMESGTDLESTSG